MKSGTTIEMRRGTPDKVPVERRFWWVAGGFVVLLFTVATVILRNQIQTNRRIQEMFTESVRGIKVSGELMDRIQETRLYSLYTLGSTDPNVQLEAADASRARDGRVTALLREHASLVAETDAPQAARQLEGRWLSYLKARDEVLAAVLEGSREEALRLDRQVVEAAFQPLHQALEESEAAYARQADARLKQIKTVSWQNVVSIGLMLGLVILGATVGLRTLRHHALLLHRSRERFELAVRGSSDSIWDWDLETNEIYFSPRWKEIIGCEDREVHDSFEEFEQRLHPEDLPQFRSALRDYFKMVTATYEIEFRVRHQDGSYRWVLARGAALRDAGGRAFRMAGSHTDITERKQSEIELRLSREKFEALVNSIDGVVWEADLKTSAFTFVSAQAERLLGYPRSQWLEQPSFWAEHIDPEDREATLRQCSEAAAQRQILRCEYRMTAADGRQVWVRDIAAVAESPGGVLTLRGVLFDISEQKKAEEEKEKLNVQLRDTSRQAGMAEIATGVLHNVGNVLNSVNISASLVVDQMRKSKSASLAKVAQLFREHREDVAGYIASDPKGKQLPGYIEALSEQLAREQEAQVQEMLSLQQNIDHIKQIVAMQQSYAKVGGLIEALPLDELVNDALRLYVDKFLRAGVEIVKLFQETPPAMVDRHKTLQILVNLIGNAHHALSESPRPDKRLTLGIAWNGEDWVRLIVQDNGLGIEPGNLKRIFSHGFTTKKTGHGFGLHSGANAAKEMGGSLQVHSDGPGTGATFILELPVRGNSTQQTLPNADDSQQMNSNAA